MPTQLPNIIPRDIPSISQIYYSYGFCQGLESSIEKINSIISIMEKRESNKISVKDSIELLQSEIDMMKGSILINQKVIKESGERQLSPITL